MCFVVCIICQWSNKHLKFFTIYHLPVSQHSFYFNTGYLYWHSNFFATYFVYFGYQSFDIFCNVTYSFPNDFSPHTTSNWLRILQDLELRGDKFRDSKKRKRYFEFQKAKFVTKFSSIQTCSLWPKQVFKMLLVILLLTQRKTYLGLLAW